MLHETLSTKVDSTLRLARGEVSVTASVQLLYPDVQRESSERGNWPWK